MGAGVAGLLILGLAWLMALIIERPRKKNQRVVMAKKMPKMRFKII